MASLSAEARAGEPKSPAERGYRVLVTKPFLPPDFDRDVFANLWTVWPEPLQSQAREADAAERRRMAFSRYGLIESPDERNGGSEPALGYVDDGRGGWVMNCLACHAGKVAGSVIPGLPNSHFALQTLTEDVIRTKAALGRPPSHLDLAVLKIPLGTSNGTTNSVVFGIAVGALRDREMNVDRSRPAENLIHHDMDAPPLWNVRKKTRLYCDGHAPKSHRVLMQFMLLPTNDGETVRGWESSFRDVLAWIESLRPPKYPWPVDAALAGRGEQVFVEHCSRCHGTYGDGGEYPERMVPIDVIGTDPVRLKALAPEHRRKLAESWMTRYGADRVDLEPAGYVAPPLDGVWASAPYFHNGSVPTLWHVLHPRERPAVWLRTEDGYDREKAGLEVETFDRLPPDVTAAADRRRYFDTTRPGKSAAGHNFPDVLNADEKQAVLEYLKTL
ncbi:MAG: cytochrome c [Planctomycetes bacterium]|nr:cytochrome c [Planctomycetota bacterium]